MPNIASAFQPPAWLRNRHLQTILPAMLRRRSPLELEAERLELPDGDFLDLQWARRGSSQVAILSHGLEGSSEAGYVRGMARALREAGWDALLWNFRGCGPESNRLPRFYHSGETGDLGALVLHAAKRYRRIALIGFSLGGNQTLKYLGEAPPPVEVCGAIAISTPVDLAASAAVLDARRGNRLYLRLFLRSLIRKIEAKARRFPADLDAAGVRAIRSFRAFDDRYTAPLHGFASALDYWTRSSARPFLPRITVPTLLLNARDDPFLTPESFPFPEAEASSALTLEVPDHGGHMGFLDFRAGLQPWSERRALAFLKSLTHSGSRAAA